MALCQDKTRYSLDMGRHLKKYTIAAAEFNGSILLRPNDVQHSSGCDSQLALRGNQRWEFCWQIHHRVATHHHWRKHAVQGEEDIEAGHVNIGQHPHHLSIFECLNLETSHIVT